MRHLPIKNEARFVRKANGGGRTNAPLWGGGKKRYGEGMPSGNIIPPLRGSPMKRANGDAPAEALLFRFSNGDVELLPPWTLKSLGASVEAVSSSELIVSKTLSVTQFHNHHMVWGVCEKWKKHKNCFALSISFVSPGSGRARGNKQAQSWWFYFTKLITTVFSTAMIGDYWVRDGLSQALFLPLTQLGRAHVKKASKAEPTSLLLLVHRPRAFFLSGLSSRKTTL